MTLLSQESHLPQTVSIRSTDTQYAVRRPSQSFNTRYEYAVRSTQAALTTAHSSIRNTGAEYAGRPQAALSTACQDVIRSTQYADTPTALTYLLLSLTNCILIRSWGPEYAVVQYVAYTVLASSHRYSCTRFESSSLNFTHESTNLSTSDPKALSQPQTPPCNPP